MNILMLDENRVICEKDELPTIKMFERTGRLQAGRNTVSSVRRVLRFGLL